MVNGENAAEGAGLTPKLAEKLLAAGADVVTLGNHVWRRKELAAYLATAERVIRPANLSAESPGWMLCAETSAVLLQAELPLYDWLHSLGDCRLSGRSEGEPLYGFLWPGYKPSEPALIGATAAWRAARSPGRRSAYSARPAREAGFASSALLQA